MSIITCHPHGRCCSGIKIIKFRVKKTIPYWQEPVGRQAFVCKKTIKTCTSKPKQCYRTILSYANESQSNKTLLKINCLPVNWSYVFIQSRFLFHLIKQAPLVDTVFWSFRFFTNNFTETENIEIHWHTTWLWEMLKHTEIKVIY